ncbi:MAG: hypothetical protein ABIH67_01260 [Candidatus Uhrbacteria bacterium]
MSITGEQSAGQLAAKERVFKEATPPAAEEERELSAEQKEKMEQFSRLAFQYQELFHEQLASADLLDLDEEERELLMKASELNHKYDLRSWQEIGFLGEGGFLLNILTSPSLVLEKMILDLKNQKKIKKRKEHDELLGRVRSLRKMQKLRDEIKELGKDFFDDPTEAALLWGMWKWQQKFPLGGQESHTE